MSSVDGVNKAVFDFITATTLPKTSPAAHTPGIQEAAHLPIRPLRLH